MPADLSFHTQNISYKVKINRGHLRTIGAGIVELSLGQARVHVLVMTKKPTKFEVPWSKHSQVIDWERCLSH